MKTLKIKGDNKITISSNDGLNDVVIMDTETVDSVMTELKKRLADAPDSGSKRRKSIKLIIQGEIDLLNEFINSGVDVANIELGVNTI